MHIHVLHISFLEYFLITVFYGALHTVQYTVFSIPSTHISYSLKCCRSALFQKSAYSKTMKYFYMPMEATPFSVGLALHWDETNKKSFPILDMNGLPSPSNASSGKLTPLICDKCLSSHPSVFLTNFRFEKISHG